MSSILRFFRRPKAYVRYWGWLVCWHLEGRWGRGTLEVVVVEHDGLSRRLARSTTASEGLRNCSVDSEVGGPNTWPVLASVRFH